MLAAVALMSKWMCGWFGMCSERDWFSSRVDLNFRVASRAQELFVSESLVFMRERVAEGASPKPMVKLEPWMEELFSFVRELLKPRVEQKWRLALEDSSFGMVMCRVFPLSLAPWHAGLMELVWS